MAAFTSSHLWIFLVICCSAVHPTYPLKILGLFPHPAISHFNFFHPIMRGLAEKGHDVTVISQFPDKAPPVGYRDIPLTGQPILSNSVDLKRFETRPLYWPIDTFFRMYGWGKEACNLTLHSDALAQVLGEREHYDVVILEQFNTDCMMAVAHQLKAPFIAMSSCPLLPWHHDIMAIPFITSSMSNFFTGLSDSMSFKERLGNWFSYNFMNILYKLYIIPTADAFVREKFGPDVPSVADLAKETAALFVNQHFSLGGVKSLPPSVVELGGIHIQKAKPLETELQKFIDTAQHGVVYFSWGSMIRAETLPPAKRDAILRAFGRLKQRVLWKWENSTLYNKPANVYTSKWLPQREILCHPNMKVFMSHGGLMGSSEAAYCGVPLVVTPMYGDQHINSQAIEYRGMGVILNYEDITEESVFKSITEVLKKEYMNNAKAVSYSYKNRPQTALETAIWWVEYVARTKGAPLAKAEAVHLSGFVYNSLDIYLFLGFSILISVLSWSFICGKFFRFRRLITEKEKTN